MQLSLLLASLLCVATAAPTFQHPTPYEFVGTEQSTDPSISKRTLGGVRLSDGADFTGHVWYGVYPLNQCIGLNDYAHNVLSFRPDEGTECLVMQERCNSEMEYADLYYNSTEVSNLGIYPWITGVESYFCMTAIFPKA